MSIDRNAILARLEVVADVLELGYAEVIAASENDDALIDFAVRHNQSIDWLILGNVRPMLKDRAVVA